MTAKITAFYSLSIDSAGYIRDHEGRIEDIPGFSRGAGYVVKGFTPQREAQTPQFARDWRESVIVLDDGQVLISREVFGAVYSGGSMWEPSVSFGSRGYQILTDELIADFIDHNSYPRRNQREVEVQERNNSLIEWLMSLVG